MKGIGLFLLGFFLAFLPGLKDLPGLASKVPHLFYDWMSGVVVAVILTAGFYRLLLKSKHLSAQLFSWGVFSGLALGGMAFYEVSYDLDAFSFFQRVQEGQVASQFYPTFLRGNENFVLFHHYLMSLPCLASYHGQKVFLSAMGFLGAVFLFRASGHQHLSVWWILSLFPSIPWWTSTYSKEAYVFLSLCLAIFAASQVGRAKWSYILLLVSCILLAFLRTWLVPIVLLAFLLELLRGRESGAVKLSVFALLSLSAAYFIFGLHLFSPEDFVERVNSVSQSWATGGSSRTFEPFSNIYELLGALPWLAFSALFRPFPGEVSGFFGFAAGMESVVLLALAAISLRAVLLRIVRKQSLDSLVVMGLVYLLIWALMTGLVSAQNLGTAARFKLQALPFLLVVFVRSWKIEK